MSGFVYFLRCGDFVKIGTSNAPNIRMSTIELYTPYPVEMIGLLPGNEVHEIALHKMFEADRVENRREWFWLTDAIWHVIRHGYPETLIKETTPHPTIQRVAAYLAQGQVRLDQFAKAIGVTDYTVDDWMRCRRNPGKRAIMAIEIELALRNFDTFAEAA